VTATDPQNKAPVEGPWAALRPIVAAGFLRASFSVASWHRRATGISEPPCAVALLTQTAWSSGGDRTPRLSVRYQAAAILRVPSLKI